MKTAYLLLATAPFVAARCPNSCSGFGKCGKYDMCTCYANHRGADCSERTCPYEKAWVTTSKGDLNFDGDNVDFTVYNKDNIISRSKKSTTVLITQDFQGGTWETWPSHANNKEGHFYMECANRGLCDRTKGTCECFDGYDGASCNRMKCPNDCNGKGKCQTTKYLTKYPKQITNQWYNDVASSSDYALWDADMAMACQCDPGYFGPDCSIRKCPVGDDSLTQTNQIYETQFIDIYSKCEGATSADWGNCDITPTATSGISGSIKLTFVDAFGDEHQTGDIAGVGAYDGNPSHPLAANAEAALHQLPDKIISPGLTVTATYCDSLAIENQDVTAGAPSTDANSCFHAIDSDGIGDLASNVYCPGYSTSGSATPVVSVLHYQEVGMAKFDDKSALATTASRDLALIEYPQCIRLVVNFNGMPGDLPDMKVDTDNVAWSDGTTTWTNAQSPKVDIGSSVTDVLAITKEPDSVTPDGGTVGYTAPSDSTKVIFSAAADCKVEAQASSTKITFGTGDDLNNVKFYKHSKVEVFCGHDGSTGTRSLGEYTVSSVTIDTNDYITLAEVIPTSTISTDCGWDSATSAVAANAKVVVKSVSHVLVTGTDDSTDDRSVNLQYAFDSVIGTNLNMKLQIKAEDNGVMFEFAAQYHACYEEYIYDSDTTTKASYCILAEAGAGRNKAADTVETIAGSTDTTEAALITQSSNSKFNGAQTAGKSRFYLNGKGTREMTECGSRGLCDTEAGVCKCFQGYNGLTCSEQAALAF